MSRIYLVKGGVWQCWGGHTELTAVLMTSFILVIRKLEVKQSFITII